MISSFSAWLSATGASRVIQENFWIVPTIQSVHILAICALAASALLIDLRLIAGRGEDLGAYGRRFMPWIWISLVVLALTGAVMLTGEPDRTLTNWVFWTKMASVAVAVAVTLLIQRPLARNAGFWTAHRPLAIGAALASIALWSLVIICGRWIAYVF
jgi:hypothetical protein